MKGNEREEASFQKSFTGKFVSSCGGQSGEGGRTRSSGKVVNGACTRASIVEFFEISRIARSFLFYRAGPFFDYSFMSGARHDGQSIVMLE